MDAAWYLVIPQNSAVLLQTNPAFIEAYMVGLNEDFARELLWQQFPAERNGTWFRTSGPAAAHKIFHQFCSSIPQAIWVITHKIMQHGKVFC